MTRWNVRLRILRKKKSSDNCATVLFVSRLCFYFVTVQLKKIMVRKTCKPTLAQLSNDSPKHRNKID
jgi:hypothetical protein